MIGNTDITIFHRVNNQFTNPQHVDGCWWFAKHKSTPTTSGLISADETTIRIWDMDVKVSKDDYIVKGCRKNPIDSVKDLHGLDYIKVTGANYNSFGGNPHVKVVGV